MGPLAKVIGALLLLASAGVVGVQAVLVAFEDPPAQSEGS